MTIISLAQEIDIEQEVIIAVLDSVLSQRGGAKDFASKAGITPVYLSYIRKGLRMASLQTAQTIAQALPLPRGEQQVWLDHIERYWELKHHIKHQGKQISEAAPKQSVTEIRQASEEAARVQDPRVAARQYMLVADVANILIEHLKLDLNPLVYLELCLVLHESYSVLNRRIEALYIAKRARFVAESLNRTEFSKDVEFLDFLNINTIRIEAVSLHNLALDRQAYEVCQVAQAHEAMKRNILYWKPHFVREQLNALAGLPRFAISEAEGLAKQALEICEKRGSEHDELLAFLIYRSLARAHSRHNNFKKAHAILEAKYKELTSTHAIGVLHRVMFLEAFAQLCWKESKLDQWQQIISEAIMLATQANLLHQLHKIQMEYPELSSRITELRSKAGTLSSIS